MQTMIRNHPRPEHGGAAHPLLTDSPARSDPATFTAAIRMALGDRVAASERDALARAIIAVVPLNNDARVSGSFGAAGHLHLLVDGWAYRANGLRDGSRQITDILLPGDICDWTPPAPNEDIRVCGPARVAVLPRPADAASLQGLARTREVATATELRRLRAQVTSLGRRSARERVAYLLCDLYGRLARIGLARNGAFTCPLTQDQLADLLGLTAVHINRVLQALRGDGLLVFSKRQVVIPDLARLHALAGWNAAVDDAVGEAVDSPIVVIRRS